MINPKKTLINLCKGIGVFFVLLVIAFFAFRNTLLQRAIAKVQAKVQTQYHSKLDVGSASFNGLAGIEMSGVVLTPEQADTLFSIGTMRASINFWYALMGDIQLKNLEVKDGFVQLVKKDSTRNFDVFLQSSDSSKTVSA